MWLWSVKLEIADRENNTAWRSQPEQQVYFSSVYEWLLHIRRLCNLREKEREARWTHNQMRGNLLFFTQAYSLLLLPLLLPYYPLLCLQCSSEISLYDNERLSKLLIHRKRFKRKFVCMAVCFHTVKGHVNGFELLATRVFRRNILSSLWSQTGVKAFVGTFGSILCQACRRTRCMTIWYPYRTWNQIIWE